MNPCIGYATGLREHPASIRGLPFPYAWLEGPQAVRLAYTTAVPQWHDLDFWPAGRLFGEQGEYRWQQRADHTLHVVLLLETGPLPLPFTAALDLLVIAATPPTSFILWGTWVDPQGDPQGNPSAGPCFYANEIPQIQTYPVALASPPDREAIPRLGIRHYRAQQAEHGEFVRCVNLSLESTAKEA